MNFEEILKIPPYSLGKEEKEKMLTKRLENLVDSHKLRCPEYARMLSGISYDRNKVSSWKDLPFLPVRVFKDISLKSVGDDEVVKTMTSSGTTGQAVSKIFLDRTTSGNQQKVMVKIVNEFTGAERMPMIIVDCPSVVKDRRMFSARGAGILGFSIFGSKKIYALDDNMKLDVEGIKEFLKEHENKKVLLFGFTFMVWQYFYKELVRLKNEGIVFDLSNGILIHGGGWKKLISKAVSQQEFRDDLREVCGLAKVHDYYGMVEQTGCIYMQCECGHLHASIFSDIVARRTKDFSICDFGEKGILQVVSSIPESYPGHSLLTEDEGVILGEDDCPCGRKGKYFEITGRIKNAEIRGCSDTFAADHSEIIEKSNEKTGVYDHINYLIGSADVIKNITTVTPRKPFDARVIDFLGDVSRKLMIDKHAKLFPDIVTLGFWLRKSSILAYGKRFAEQAGQRRIGRGVAFHIAPSNVAVNYAYSLFTGLLCGNANIVRVPSKRFAQVDIINRIIDETLDIYPDLRAYICLVRYERNKEINDAISSICDVRIIWGGDNTIAEIRKSPIGPRASEITFADRYSLAVIDSDLYMESENKERIAADFYNDTYLSDQNACTSPRAVVWMGSKKEEARKRFWVEVNSVIQNRYDIQPIQSVDKLTTKYEVMANNITDLSEESDFDNRILRIHVKELKPELMKYRSHSGFFYEYDCNDIMDIKDFCNNVHCQTIAIYGDKKLVNPLLNIGVKGIDRITKIGHTMDFDLIWDGYNLVDRLTRNVAL